VRDATRAFVKRGQVLTGKQKHETLSRKVTVMHLGTDYYYDHYY
jgi:hypothetical protein